MASITKASSLAQAADHSWRILAIGVLAVRFVQGGIYWGERFAELYLRTAKTESTRPLDGV